MMKAKIEIELQPFSVPNYVLAVTAPKLRQEGVTFDAPKFSLSDLDSETLHKLCSDFYDEVFRKAGKEQPPRAA